jgi:membrane protease YdiL (CAAX protease family)
MMFATLAATVRKCFALTSPRDYIGSVCRDARTTLARVARDRAALAAIILLLLPWWSLIFLRSNTDWLDSFGGLVGVIFLFWWMSRSGSTPAPEVKRPRLEALFAIALVVLWVGWRAGICGKLFPFLPADASCFKNWQLEIIPKLIEQVVFPIAVLFAAGYRWRAQGIDLNRRAWWIASLTLVVFAGYGFATHWSNPQGFVQSTGEYFFAAGLPEEVLFRAILLTRLEAWWRSSAWALFGTSVIFGLTHIPMDYLVFTSRDWREAWIMLLTFQMGMGAVFAFAYQRTRNVFPVALLHALVDALHF